MSLADRPRPRLVVVPSTPGRHLFAFVWLPRDDLSTRRRVAIGEMLSAAATAALLSWSTAMEERVVAPLRYPLHMRPGGPNHDSHHLDARLTQTVPGWGAHVADRQGGPVVPAHH